MHEQNCRNPLIVPENSPLMHTLMVVCFGLEEEEEEEAQLLQRHSSSAKKLQVQQLNALLYTSTSIRGAVFI